MCFQFNYFSVDNWLLISRTIPLIRASRRICFEG